MNLNKNCETVYYNASNACFVVHGLPWFFENQNFSRLPNDVFVSKNIEFLKLHPSGAYLSFSTNSTFIKVKATVSSKSYMSHMPATGILGCDLYILDKGKWLFLNTTKVDQANYEMSLVDGMPKQMMQYRLYLPLYIALQSLEVGVEQGAIIQSSEPIKQEKIVFYGTSITQGGCASRPGMNETSLIGRWTNTEIINMGFSGSAHLEPQMAEAISNILHIQLLVLEIEANAGEALVLKERLEPFVNIILEKQPSIQIILISHYPYALANYKPDMLARFLDHFQFQKQLCKKNNWTFIDGKKILNKLGYEETVDGVHLTDLGFYTLAKSLTKTIKKLLG